MSAVLIVCPLGVEALAVRSASKRLRVRTTGMGPLRAKRAVPALAADPAVALVVVGFGGGLSVASRLCEVVVASEIVEVDGRGMSVGERVACAAAPALHEALGDAGLPVCEGVVASAQQIITGEARARIEATGAIAVDMESAWVAEAAAGRPFAVVRVLSDTPERELRARLPIGPPLPTFADGMRAMATLRRVGAALAWLAGRGELHTVLGVTSVEDRG